MCKIKSPEGLIYKMYPIEYILLSPVSSYYIILLCLMRYIIVHLVYKRSTTGFFIVDIKAVIDEISVDNKGFSDKINGCPFYRTPSWERRNRTKSLWGNVSLLRGCLRHFLMSIL
ncbi:hypothetical protein ERIC1_3c00700 [Paenibacillus larvae subsp. larvae DSM 25719]|nr:hypothetical protein ERIC1_3c00700 [Paenibacillus larvae subsp. larvae DSM 25719]